MFWIYISKLTCFLSSSSMKFCCIVPSVRSIHTFLLIATAAVATLIQKFYWPVVVSNSVDKSAYRTSYTSSNHQSIVYYMIHFYDFVFLCIWFWRRDRRMKTGFHFAFFLIIYSLISRNFTSLSRQYASNSPAVCVYWWPHLIIDASCVNYDDYGFRLQSRC